MAINEIICPACQAACLTEAASCSACGTSLIVAKLVSTGSGIMPRNFSWRLKPMNYRIGRALDNHLVIPSPSIPAVAAELIYSHSQNRFSVRAVDTAQVAVDSRPISSITALANQSMLQILREQFRLEMLSPSSATSSSPSSSGAHSSELLATNLQETLGIIVALQTATDERELARLAVDGVVRVSQTRRGFFFVVDNDHSDNGDEMILHILAARAADGSTLTNDNYDVSQSVLEKIISGNDDMIVIQDAVRENAMTATMRKNQLRALLCLPLTRPPRHPGAAPEVIGAIYADNTFPTSAMPPDCAATLRLFAQVVSAKLLYWQQLNHTRNQLQHCRRVITRCYGRLEQLRQQSSGTLAETVEEICRDMGSALSVCD